LDPSVEPALSSDLGELARRCWFAFGLEGYVRVDFRVDSQGQPWILEINTNPCLSADAGFAATLKQAGLTLNEAVERIVNAALRGRS
jgi:D-alanine-D-alanine ligase